MSLDNLKDADIEKVIKVFKDLARYNNLERESYDEILKQKKAYVQLIPDDICIKALFQTIKERKVNYVIGRRGTGKTTILKRARTECLESFFIKKDLDYLKQEKMVLPIYIEIKNLFLNVLDKISLKGDDIEDLVYLIRNLNIELIRQVENTYDELRGLGVISDSMFLKIEDLINKQIDNLVNRNLPISKVNAEELRDYYAILKRSIEEISYFSDNNKLLLESGKYEGLSTIFKNLFDINGFKELFNDLKLIKEFPLNYIHFFIDDFSEISIINQKIIIESFVEPLFKDVSDLCFCIACYPELYYTGSLKKQQDYQTIELDYCKLCSDEPYERRIQRGIDASIQLVFKSLNSELADIFRDVKTLNILFDDVSSFFKHLFFMSMNVPRLIGLILSHPKCIMSLKMKSKLSINRIIEASEFVYREFLYKDYFSSLLKESKSNYYFSEHDIIHDKYLIDKLIRVMKEDFKGKPNGFFIIDDNTIKSKDLISRLELMGFIYRLGSLPDEKILFCFYYGGCTQNKINFSLDKDLNFWSENENTYNISTLLTDIFNMESIDENLLYNQEELPQRYIKEKTNFDEIHHQLNEDQIKIIHTLYLYKDENKGWMTPDEIGITKRIFPFYMPHMRIIRIMRGIRNLGKARFLIGETEKGKIFYRISNLGILFEDYSTWKLNV
ncbi:MAG: hypothetical protein ACFFBT_01030 [Promethearchaeota archaeon]